VITCVLCGKPMAEVAPGVLLHLDELVSLLPRAQRSTFLPLTPVLASA
jgi:hypothetical protein